MEIVENVNWLFRISYLFNKEIITKTKWLNRYTNLSLPLMVALTFCCDIVIVQSSDLCEGSDIGKPFSCSVSDLHHTELQNSDAYPLKEQSMTKIDLHISKLAELEPLLKCVM